MPYKNKDEEKAYYACWYESNRESKIEQSCEYGKEHRKERNSYERSRNARLRGLCFDHYGRECACCGETELLFLTFDHINGGGNKHNRKVGYIPRWLVSQGFPDGFQVLCMNCNLGRSINGGVCPHQEKDNA